MRSSVARCLPSVLRAALLAGAVACASEKRPTGLTTVESVEVAAPSNTLVVGQTTQLTAIPRDATGAPLADRPITWTTDAPLIATVSEDGLVSAVAAGSAVISATAEDRTGTLELTIRTVPVASVTVDPGVAALVVGGSVQLTATPRDANGQPLAGRPVTWATSDPAILSVTDGSVTAHAAGFGTITAESEGRQRRVDITVCATTSVFITGVFPAALSPGTQGIIAGCNFTPSVAGNTVVLDGRALTVQSATANELRVMLPTTGYSCEPTRLVTLTVTSGAGSAQRSQRLATGAQHALAVGASVTQLDPAAIRCNELIAAGARYVISVFNTTAAPGVQTAVQLRGAAGAAVVPPSASALSAPMVRLASPPTSPLSMSGARPSAERAHAHANVLEENRAILRRLGNPVAHLAARRPTMSATTASSGPSAPSLGIGAVGDVGPMRVWQRGTGSCGQYQEVTARTVYVGARTIIREDVAAPLAGQMDDMYVALGEEFDAAMWPILTQHFGDPLVLDADLDANQRVVMLFTKHVNDADLAGFVISCDFFPRTSAAASNEGEVLYAFVPTDAIRGYVSNAFTRDEWRREVRATLIHEAKHITSFAERISRGAAGFEESWLEEGTAMHAEEIWSRLPYGSQWKGNTTYRNSIYCDLRQTIAECADAPLVMFSHFAHVYDYMEAVENLSPLGQTGEGDFTFYGSAWSFVRWVIDQHAASDASFLKPLTQERTLTGVANITARTGKTFAELLGDWTLAMAVDDYSGFAPLRPELTFPSWHTRDIFLAFNRDFSGFPRSFPLVMRPVQFGTFAVDVTMRGGTAALFELTGSQSATQLLELRTSGGGAPPDNLRIAIVRVQ